MQEKRRSERVSYNVTIQLVGMQPGAASAVAQPARAIDVSDRGALIECRSKFETGADLMVYNLQNFQTGLFKVVRALPSPTGAGWQLGVELQDPGDTDFWGLASPPPQPQ